MEVLPRRHDPFCGNFSGPEDCAIRNLELIGEAATKIPEPIKAANEHIPWRKIIATRNRLIHGYLGIDDDIIWSIIQQDIPALHPQLRSLRELWDSE